MVEKNKSEQGIKALRRCYFYLFNETTRGTYTCFTKKHWTKVVSHSGYQCQKDEYCWSDKQFQMQTSAELSIILYFYESSVVTPDFRVFFFTNHPSDCGYSHYAFSLPFHISDFHSIVESWSRKSAFWSRTSNIESLKSGEVGCWTIVEKWTEKLSKHEVWSHHRAFIHLVPRSIDEY